MAAASIRRRKARESTERKRVGFSEREKRKKGVTGPNGGYVVV